MTIHQMEDDRPPYIRLKAIEDQIKKLTKERKTMLEELVPKGNQQFEFEGKTYQAKVVTSTTKAVDLMGLRKKHPQVFDQVTKRVLDRPALNIMLEMNKFPLSALDLITEENNASFIRLSKVNETGDELEYDEAETA